MAFLFQENRSHWTQEEPHNNPQRVCRFKKWPEAWASIIFDFV